MKMDSRWEGHRDNTVICHWCAQVRYTEEAKVLGFQNDTGTSLSIIAYMLSPLALSSASPHPAHLMGPRGYFLSSASGKHVCCVSPTGFASLPLECRTLANTL